MSKKIQSQIHKQHSIAIASLLALAGMWTPAGAQEPPPYWSLPVEKLTVFSAPRSSKATAEMIAIPAGRYQIGRDDGAKSQRPKHQVPLNSFRIDRTEVTNAQFAEFLNALKLPVRGNFDAGGISRKNADDRTARLLSDAAGSRSYPIIELDDDEARIVLRDGRFVPAPGHENRPVTETTWAGARAYCIWRGGDLPTEVQWEAAARGVDDRLYPWGNTEPNEKRAFTSGRTGATTDVGLLKAGASPFGVLDMAGSLAEWTKSLSKPYPYLPDDGREDVNVQGERVTRGGDYVYDRNAAKLTVSFRNGYSKAPYDGHRHIGLRCVS
ncbi:formylglycine-generating enzyme family protein [Sinorhizobium fredii]|uniref:formylglycine-generating enzyme family protein n=1 Tax=Rhizobium fredii TaxID=380 RepID=UPI0012FE0FE1|nr:SUMF1/EgtB/PvdO family nonheme iron enzyme [Sinorhizobium fredii]